MSKLFGGQKKQSQTGAPFVIPRLPAVSPNISTAGGSFLRSTLGTRSDITPRSRLLSGGRDVQNLTDVGIDIGFAPEVAALREEGLEGFRNILGDVQGDIQTLRGLENPFMQARVQPFVAQRERAGRDAARRGVSGPLSALATNPFTAQIAEQGSLAAFDSQQAIAQRQVLARELAGDISGVGQQVLAQELAALGLSAEVIQMIINSQLEQTTDAQQFSESRTDPNIFSSLFPTGHGLGRTKTPAEQGD